MALHLGPCDHAACKRIEDRYEKALEAAHRQIRSLNQQLTEMHSLGINNRTKILELKRRIDLDDIETFRKIRKETNGDGVPVSEALAEVEEDLEREIRSAMPPVDEEVPGGETAPAGIGVKAKQDW